MLMLKVVWTWCLCVLWGVCCVVLVVVIVACVLLCVWCGTLKNPPCVRSKRPRVYKHHVLMYKICARGAGTHPAATRTLQYAADIAASRNGEQLSAKSLQRRWKHEIQIALLRRRAAMTRAVLPNPSLQPSSLSAPSGQFVSGLLCFFQVTSRISLSLVAPRHALTLSLKTSSKTTGCPGKLQTKCLHWNRRHVGVASPCNMVLSALQSFQRRMCAHFQRDFAATANLPPHSALSSQQLLDLTDPQVVDGKRRKRHRHHRCPPPRSCGLHSYQAAFCEVPRSGPILAPRASAACPSLTDLLTATAALLARRQPHNDFGKRRASQFSLGCWCGWSFTHHRDPEHFWERPRL